MKAILLSLFMLSAIGLFGLGIYTADAGGVGVDVNGYGVVAAGR
jgi:hypothetical protein